MTELFGIGAIAILIFVLLAIVTVKMIRKKELPALHYTPYDYITGHSPVEFHDEKEEYEDEEDKGDDKDKFRYKLK